MDEDYQNRPSWIDARTCYKKVKKGQVDGQSCGLFIRWKLQSIFFCLGYNIQRHCGKVLFIGLLIFSLCSLGLRLIRIDKDPKKLWISPSGRVAEELRYSEKFLKDSGGVDSQFLLQTSDSDNLLSKRSLLSHLDVLLKITNIKVSLFNEEWTFEDVCHKHSFYNGQEGSKLLNNIVEGLTPCSIVSIFDCFWEGSKILGPTHPVYVPSTFFGLFFDLPQEITWKNLDIDKFVKILKRHRLEGFEALISTLNKSGIRSGYINKPCLDNTDSECPNRNVTINAREVLELETCSGFAEKFMGWNKKLLVNGKYGRTKALQSIIHLMGPEYLFNYHDSTQKTQKNMEKWTMKEAEMVLTKWHLEMKKIINNESNKFYILTSDDFDGIVEEFCKIPIEGVTIAYSLWIIYSVLINLNRNKKLAMSQISLSVSSILIILLSTASALGLCCVFGLDLNALTFQLLPFIIIGANYEHVILFLQTYKEVCSSDVDFSDKIGHVMKRCSLDIVLPIVCNYSILFVTYFVFNATAVGCFILQLGIVILMNLIGLCIVLPSIMSLDLQKRMNDENMIQRPDCNHVCVQIPNCSKDKSNSCTDTYGTFLERRNIQILIIICLLMAVVVGILGILRISVGMNILDFSKKGSDRYEALKTRENHFPNYYTHIVNTDDFDYTSPYNQKLMFQLEEELLDVKGVVQSNRTFWLRSFRDWLQGLQKVFNKEKSIFRKAIKTSPRNIPEWSTNMSYDGIVAFKLLGQTPTKFRSKKALTTKLVRDGIINPKLFYKLLSAWTSENLLAYSFSEAQLKPEPKEWKNDYRNDDCEVQKSKPLAFSQMPLLMSFTNEDDILPSLSRIREICEKYTSMGISSFPKGELFTYLDDLHNLKLKIIVAFGACLVVLSVIITLFLMQLWFAAVLTSTLLFIYVEILGFSGIINLKLNGLSAVIMLTTFLFVLPSVLRFFVAYVTNIGTRTERLKLTLQQFLPIYVKYIMGFLLVLLVIIFTHFIFIFKYFFILYILAILFLSSNLLVTIPIILYLINPRAQIELGDEPMPKPSPMLPKPRKKPLKDYDKKNLSTITEESSHAGSDSQINKSCRVFVSTRATPINNSNNNEHFSNKTTDQGNKSQRMALIKTTTEVTVEVHQSDD